MTSTRTVFADNAISRAIVSVGDAVSASLSSDRAAYLCHCTCFGQSIELLGQPCSFSGLLEAFDALSHRDLPLCRYHQPLYPV